MKRWFIPVLATCLWACASGQQTPSASTSMSMAPTARILMCPDLDRRDVFFCPASERALPACSFNRENYRIIGDIDVAKTGTSGYDREVYDAFVDRARRLKPDAIIEFRREQRRGSNVWRLQGRAIEFLNPSCKTPR
jgi:hypothetical protein